MRRNRLKENIKRYPVRFREDIGPYITIGGKRYPLDDSKYDPRLGSDEVMNRFDREYKADEAEKAKKARRAKAKDIESKNEKLVSGKSSYQDKFEALYDEYVPIEGKTDSLGGEIIRAVAKIGHRWNNDGDVFFIDYGIKTCGKAAKFLVDLYNTDDHEYLKGFNTLITGFNSEVVENGTYDSPKSFDEYMEEKYDTFVNEDLIELTVDTLIDHPELFLEDTKDMFDTKLHDGDFEEPVFDYWLEYPYEIYRFLEKDVITVRDIRSYVEDLLWSSSYLCCENIDFESDHLEISGFSYDDWTTFDESWNPNNKFFDQYIEDLIEEYGDPDDYEEDEEDEE